MRKKLDAPLGVFSFRKGQKIQQRVGSGRWDAQVGFTGKTHLLDRWTSDRLDAMRCDRTIRAVGCGDCELRVTWSATGRTVRARGRDDTTCMGCGWG
ncbi:hypothetical protein MA16_Dca002807 [Dendrobium catenatum]|uniref:Uncharacterized protein n=1 Tax=Dendrobium catenatum TaxID=906689 RepID=A0A2I0X8T1_9ASPA|nr:hypothetical protein MA16_Dca002807 [Dendrobium catenatum]